MKEIQAEAEGASAIIDFLKEHDRKTAEKALVQKAIDRNEKRLKDAEDEIYGRNVGKDYMEMRTLLEGVQVPQLDRMTQTGT